MWNLLIAGLASAAMVQEPTPVLSGFRKLDYPSALIAAQAESRPLLVDFFDSQSNEWVVMQKVTWGDPITARWLEARVVAVQFDLREQRELAEKLGVATAPTAVFLTSEGLEIDRLAGFVDARNFMSQGQSIVACEQSVQPARLALAADPKNPTAHVDLGLAYLGCRRLARALDEALWAWDHGYERLEFRDARLSELPLVLKRVIAAYPGGRQPVIERRDALQAKLLEFAEGADWVRLASEISALNTALFAEKKQLALFSQLVARPGTPRAVIAALYSRMLVDMLIRDQRWADLLAGCEDVLVLLDRDYLALKDVEIALERGDEPALGVSPEALAIRRNGTLHLAGGYVQALFATGKPREAVQAIDLVLLHDRRAMAHHTMMRACLAGREPGMAKDLLERAERAGFPAAELEPLRKTLAAATAPAQK